MPAPPAGPLASGPRMVQPGPLGSGLLLSAPDPLDGPTEPDQTEPDQIELFLNCCSSPVPAPLLATPAPPPPRTPVEVARPPVMGSIRHSGRLAAKPTSKLSTMDKVLHVLMKKEGLIAEVDPGEVAMEKFKDLCKKPLPSGFVAAVSSLLATASPARGGTAQRGMQPGAVAA